MRTRRQHFCGKASAEELLLSEKEGYAALDSDAKKQTPVD
jgi:hypothetical protein